MGQTYLSIRIDDKIKEDFTSLCDSIGLSASTAVLIFIKKAVSEQRIPFSLTANSGSAAVDSCNKDSDYGITIVPESKTKEG